MARAATQRFDEMVLELEGTTPGVYAKICGMVGVTITRTANVEESEVPDCDNEALPHEIDAEVRSISVSVTATGVWASSSQDALKAWFYSGQPRNIRLRDVAAAVGDIQSEAGPALLTSLSNERAKGQKVTANIELRFKTIPTLTDRTV